MALLGLWNKGDSSAVASVLMGKQSASEAEADTKKNESELPEEEMGASGKFNWMADHGMCQRYTEQSDSIGMDRGGGMSL